MKNDQESFMIRAPEEIVTGNVSINQFYAYINSLGEDIGHLNILDYIQMWTMLAQIIAVTPNADQLAELRRSAEVNNDLQ